MTEHSSNDSHQVKHIAEATQKDSEAMKTNCNDDHVLPAGKLRCGMFEDPTPDTAGEDQRLTHGALVRQCFSMGVFAFDFDGGRRGVLSLSSYWWIYAVVAIPLTIGTFVFFSFMHGRQQNEAKATEAKRVE
jgi:hypothetical protein